MHGTMICRDCMRYCQSVSRKRENIWRLGNPLVKNRWPEHRDRLVLTNFPISLYLV